MKKLILLCIITLMYCVTVKAQTSTANAKAANDVTTDVKAPVKAATAALPTVSVTLQNNTSCCTYQIQFIPLDPGGTSASYNFSSSQNVNIVAGHYNVGMRGPGGTLHFSYSTCATSGSITGSTALFSNVYICSNGTFSVNP
ncbi:MAG: hypothetical protein V4577_02805 [Bacteroidota bacterium]